MSDVNPCISQDIWFEIFKELPVKTLGKCRCVCKSWHSLIVSPSFMASHLKHYTRNNANSLLLYKEISQTGKFEQCIFFRDLVQLKLGNRLHTSVCPFALPLILFSSFFDHIGSINGLLCVSDPTGFPPEDRIFLWNPLIKKSIKLPKSTDPGTYFVQSVLGFGYDYQRNDHRVVKINFRALKTPMVEVYSVQERTWRIICARYLVDNSINWVYSSHCFLNGVIHWSTKDTRLLLFNVSDETFMKKELPEEIVKSCVAEFSNFGLFEYQGKLSVSLCGNIQSSYNIISADCHIWVKRDYNVESSWCKILFVESDMLQRFCHVGPIEYLGEGEELVGFAKFCSRELVSYDPKTRQITELGLRLSESTNFSAYSESLALLDQKIDELTTDELKRCWWC